MRRVPAGVRALNLARPYRAGGCEKGEPRAADGSPDTFRIKIWDLATEDVMYDDQVGAGDDDYAGTALGGGSIKVHKG